MKFFYTILHNTDSYSLFLARELQTLLPDWSHLINWLAWKNPMRASDVAAGASVEHRMQDSASGSIAVDNEHCLSVGCENAAQSNDEESNLQVRERRNAEKYLDLARETIKGPKFDQKRDDCGRTGLMIAGRYGDLELMREYLEKGANIFKTAGGYSRDDVLTETLRGGNEGCISLLLDQPGAIYLVQRDKMYDFA
jgi:ankyrin repeat protein